MSNKMYVGNLPFSVDESQLRGLFSEFGTVSEATLVTDRDSGRTRGFGFVSMEDSAGMNAAILGLDGRQVEGRALTVNEARPREQRPAAVGGRSDRRQGSRW